MRLRIDTSEIKFRVAALAKPRARSRADQTQNAYSDDSDRSVQGFRTVWIGGRVAADAGRLFPALSPPFGSGCSVPWAGGPGLERRA